MVRPVNVARSPLQRGIPALPSRRCGKRIAVPSQCGRPFSATQAPVVRARPRYRQRTRPCGRSMARLPQGENRSPAHYQQISLRWRGWNPPSFEARPRGNGQGKPSLARDCRRGGHPGLRLRGHRTQSITRTRRCGCISGLYSSPAIVDGRYGGMILLVGLRPSRRPHPFACPSWRFD
jgi:hypothetical protein